MERAFAGREKYEEAMITKTTRRNLEKGIVPRTERE
jgi:hypothetical protein